MKGARAVSERCLLCNSTRKLSYTKNHKDDDDSDFVNEGNSINGYWTINLSYRGKSCSHNWYVEKIKGERVSGVSRVHS